MWVGVAAGLYLFVIGLTGAILVFRQDLQRAAYPQFFAPPRGRNAPTAEVGAVLADLRLHYPGAHVSGIDWPTDRRDSFLAYVSNGGDFRTVFSHPVSGRVIGELPYDWIRRVQDLHFELLGGRTGRNVNGIGALACLVMVGSGLIIWTSARRRTGVRNVHALIGVGCALWLLTWGATGAWFSVPQLVRPAFNAVLPQTLARAPDSRASADADAHLAPEAFVERARRVVPRAQLARLVMPFTARSAFLVVMARDIHGDVDTSDEVQLWFDRYTGEPLELRDQAVRTRGDWVAAWITPIHTGSFGGLPIKLVWAGAALGIPVLSGTGLWIWAIRRSRRAA